MIAGMIIWLLAGFVTIGLAVLLITAVIAILVARMSNDGDWRD